MWAMPRRCSYTKPAGSETVSEDSRKNNFGFWGRITLTPPLSHRMGEGESSSVGRPIQPLWKLRATGLAVPSPVGRERVRVRVVLLKIRLLSGNCFCTNPKHNGLHLLHFRLLLPDARAGGILRAARALDLAQRLAAPYELRFLRLVESLVRAAHVCRHGGELRLRPAHRPAGRERAPALVERNRGHCAESRAAVL